MPEPRRSALPGQHPGEDRAVSHTFVGIGMQHLRVRTRRVVDKSGNSGLVLVSFAAVSRAPA